MRRRPTWHRSVLVVFFNLLLLLLFLLLLLVLFTFASTASEAKPSCAACLATGRAIDHALSKTMGKEMHSNAQRQQQQQRRRRSFPAFATESAVAATLTGPAGAEVTCNEVRFWFRASSPSSPSCSRVSPERKPFSYMYKREKKKKTKKKNITGPAAAPQDLPLAPRHPLDAARRFLPQRLAVTTLAFKSTPSATPFLRGGALRPAERVLQTSRGLGRAVMKERRPRKLQHFDYFSHSAKRDPGERKVERGLPRRGRSGLT